MIPPTDTGSSVADDPLGKLISDHRMVHIGKGVFTSVQNVDFMEVALQNGLAPSQFSTLAAFIAAVERLLDRSRG
jgi:hypothetical protein